MRFRCVRYSRGNNHAQKQWESNAQWLPYSRGRGKDLMPVAGPTSYSYMYSFVASELPARQNLNHILKLSSQERYRHCESLIGDFAVQPTAPVPPTSTSGSLLKRPSGPPSCPRPSLHISGETKRRAPARVARLAWELLSDPAHPHALRIGLGRES